MPVPLPITGTWADFLAPGRGYAYLDGDTLRLLAPGAQPVTVATGVTEAAVAPGGERIAFVTHDPASSDRSTEVVGYDTNLRVRYRLVTEPEAVEGLAWSPDGQSLAYRLAAADTAHRQIRVRSLRDGGTVTVATGDVSAPAWQADHQHVVFSASVPTPAGPARKAFRFAVSDGLPHALTAAAGMPSAAGVEVADLRPSPDGHSLAFLSDAGGRPGVFTMNADGTGLTQLTDSDPDRFPYSARAVGWTPG
jgi:Tol biopolymer transport system component